MKLSAQDTKVKPIKKLGQNYLTDKNILKKIVSSVQILPEDPILEIGPGTGALTTFLYGVGSTLTVIEIDTRVHELLANAFPGTTIIPDDFRKVNLQQVLPEKKTVVFGNIPYYLTSTILFGLLQVRHRIKSVTLLIQKEVAQRIVAQHGNKEYGILSVLLGTYCETKIEFEVSPNVFFPKPKVRSAVITLVPREVPVGIIHDEKFFEQIIKRAFQQRRKTLRNSIREFLPEIIPPELEQFLHYRPEQLTRNQLIHLTNLLTPNIK